MLHTCSKNLCQRGGGQIFFPKNVLSENIIFVVDYQIILQYAYCNLKFWSETIHARI